MLSQHTDHKVTDVPHWGSQESVSDGELEACVQGPTLQVKEVVQLQVATGTLICHLRVDCDFWHHIPNVGIATPLAGDEEFCGSVRLSCGLVRSLGRKNRLLHAFVEIHVGTLQSQETQTPLKGLVLLVESRVHLHFLHLIHCL